MNGIGARDVKFPKNQLKKICLKGIKKDVGLGKDSLSRVPVGQKIIAGTDK